MESGEGRGETVPLLKKLKLKWGFPGARKHLFPNNVKTEKALCWLKCGKTIAANFPPPGMREDKCALALDNRAVATSHRSNGSTALSFSPAAT